MTNQSDLNQHANQTTENQDLCLIEGVGSQFHPIDFDKCREKSWLLLENFAAQIKAGMSELEAQTLYKVLCKEHGVEKNWHAAKIRFGLNTTKGFREASEPGVVLKDEDLFFLDLGPVFFNHEGDVGKTFCLGNNKDYLKVINDCKTIFDIVKKKWKNESLTGEMLYEFAENKALERGWQLNLNGASGHRIGDFPHALYYKGNLKSISNVPRADRWILEIQIRHPTEPYGAFYEDLLA